MVCDTMYVIAIRRAILRMPSLSVTTVLRLSLLSLFSKIYDGGKDGRGCEHAGILSYFFVRLTSHVTLAKAALPRSNFQHVHWTVRSGGSAMIESPIQLFHSLHVSRLDFWIAALRAACCGFSRESFPQMVHPSVVQVNIGPLRNSYGPFTLYNSA